MMICKLLTAQHNAHIIIVQQKIREAKQKCISASPNTKIIFKIMKISLKQLDHCIFPIAGQSSCQKFLAKRQFAIGMENLEDPNFRLFCCFGFSSSSTSTAYRALCQSCFPTVPAKWQAFATRSANNTFSSLHSMSSSLMWMCLVTFYKSLPIVAL